MYTLIYLYIYNLSGHIMCISVIILYGINNGRIINELLRRDGEEQIFVFILWSAERTLNRCRYGMTFEAAEYTHYIYYTILL